MKENIKQGSIDMVQETIEKIQEIVQIGSVRDLSNPTTQAPFGPGILASLEKVLEYCSDMGMRTFIDPNGLYAYAEIGPEDSKEMIGVVGHVDVVPTGEEKQWTMGGSFSGAIVDNKIIGRGSLDDKGPVVLNIMALKLLLAQGVEIQKRIRFIFGTAEETTWECMDAYTKLEEHPTVSYSPDADFPVIHAEKGIFRSDVVASDKVEFTLFADGAYNAVSDTATYTGSKLEEVKAEMDKLGFGYKVQADSLIATGMSAHAMQSFKGTNAINNIAQAMHNVGETCPAVEFLATVIGDDRYGINMFGDLTEEVSGSLTTNIGFCDIKDGYQKFGFDMRIPVLADADDVIKTFGEVVAKHGMALEDDYLKEKLYVEADSKLVSTLMNIYKDVTGHTDALPLTSGGGTYARAFDNCVAFGCVLRAQGMVDLMHQPNENFEIEYIQPALEIYANALYELNKM